MPVLRLLGPVVRQAVSKRAGGRALFLRRFLPGVLAARAAFVAEHFIADDRVDLLRLLFRRFFFAHGGIRSKEQAAASVNEASFIHCHILAHEDRGMMTVVEVAPSQSPCSHH